MGSDAGAPPSPPDPPARRAPRGQHAGASDGGGDRWAAVLPALRVLGFIGVIVVFAAAVAAVVRSGPPSRADLLREAGLSGKSELLIGVKSDQPGISLRDPATGRFAGFDIDIAHLVAADLGFRPDEVRLLTIESEDRARMRARSPEGRYETVDLVIASYSITPEREALSEVSFAGPYLITEQSVITRAGHPPVAEPQDLAGERICSLATSTSADAFDRAGVRVRRHLNISMCVDDLLAGDTDAVTTDAAILAGFVHQHPDDLVHHDIGLAASERYGINTGGDEALRTLVDLALTQSRENPRDRRWEQAYETHLAPAQASSPQQDIAEDAQPAIDKDVEVRIWPWERDALLAPVAPADTVRGG